MTFQPACCVYNETQLTKKSSCPGLILKIQQVGSGYISHVSFQKYSRVKGQNNTNPQTISPIKSSSNENYLGELEDTNIKRTAINFIKDFKEFKENTNNSTNLQRMSSKNARVVLKKTQL